MYRAKGRYIRGSGASRVTDGVKNVERREIVGGEDEDKRTEYGRRTDPAQNDLVSCRPSRQERR